MLGGVPGEVHGAGGNFMTFKHGALHGGLVGVLIAFPVLGTNAIFEQKSAKYILINAGYWILTMSLMGGVINSWV